MNARTSEKTWIKRGSQSQRCGTIASIGRALIKEARGGDIAGSKETIAAGHQRGELRR